MIRLAAAALIALALTGCQTPPSNGGGVNGYEHPSAGDYQSHTFMVAGGLGLIAAGTGLLIVTGRRADR